MIPETSNEDGGMKMSDVVTEQEDTIDRLVNELAEAKKVSARKERKLSFLIDVLEDGRCMMGDDLHEHLERLDDE